MPGPDHEQLVRDLVWAVQSPSLLTGAEVGTAMAPRSDDGAAGVATSARLDPAQINPQELADYVGPHLSRSVGRYFELLIGFWLDRVRRVELIASGLVIRSDERTLGELDFVFADEHGVASHWEVAVKFYLHSPGRDRSCFPGPNARDDFETKVARLFDHQLRLSETNGPTVKVRQAFVKGRVFYQPDIGQPDNGDQVQPGAAIGSGIARARPSRMAPNHERGVWLRFVEHARLFHDWSDARFAVLDKPFWLGAPGEWPLDCAQTVDFIRGHFSASDRALMLDVKTRDQSWRVCMVDDNWDS